MKVVKIYSKTCCPCKVLEKNLQLAGIEHESVDINSEAGEEAVDQYGIRTVPTLVLLNDNNELIRKQVGLLNVEELKKFVNEAD